MTAPQSPSDGPPRIFDAVRRQARLARSAARFPQVAIVQPGDTLTFTCAADDTAYIRTALTVAFPWDS